MSVPAGRVGERWGSVWDRHTPSTPPRAAGAGRGAWGRTVSVPRGRWGSVWDRHAPSAPPRAGGVWAGYVGTEVSVPRGRWGALGFRLGQTRSVRASERCGLRAGCVGTEVSVPRGRWGATLRMRPLVSTRRSGYTNPMLGFSSEEPFCSYWSWYWQARPPRRRTRCSVNAPPIGFSTGCAYLVTVMDGATTLLRDSTQLPVDGMGSATLVGAQNSSSRPLTSLPIRGNGAPILAFSGNGLCPIVPAPPGCPFGPTGFEGPGTSFIDISPDRASGTVVFNPPIPPGGHAYFAVAGIVSASSSPLSMVCTPNAGPVLFSATCIASGGTGSYSGRWRATCRRDCR